MPGIPKWLSSADVTLLTSENSMAFVLADYRVFYMPPNCRNTP